MIYDPARHLPLTSQTWNSEVVRAKIIAIAADLYKDRDAETGLWRLHPKDEHPEMSSFNTSFYFGAAGIVWGLRELAREFSEIADPGAIDLIAAHQRLNPNEEASERGAYFAGEAGVRGVQVGLHADPGHLAELKVLIRAQMRTPYRELLYGSPGTMLLAHHMNVKTGDAEFRELALQTADHLLSERTLDEPSGARIWIQDFGKQRQFIGAAHGTVGNSAALLRVVQPNERADIIANLEKLLSHYAHVEGEHCNWPRTTADDAYGKLLAVHWCHGAPGLVMELAELIAPSESEILDQLFEKAANLTWRAGPLEKGTSLCHGTAGSGATCLKMYTRTRNLVWLERARALAMHALQQHEAEFALYGRPRPSLWTGDVGLALFLRDAIRGRAELPGLDVL